MNLQSHEVVSCILTCGGPVVPYPLRVRCEVRPSGGDQYALEPSLSRPFVKLRSARHALIGGTTRCIVHVGGTFAKWSVVRGCSARFGRVSMNVINEEHTKAWRWR